MTDQRAHLVLITHGEFGVALIESAAMILGPLDDVHALSLLPGMDPAALSAQLVEVLDGCPEGSLVLTDVFGGTPSNVAAAVAVRRGFQVMSGMNLPMVLEFEMARLGNADYRERVLSAGAEGVRDINAMMQERKGS
jgi:mannose/fructose-specific phosphotransferase system component IIA